MKTKFFILLLLLLSLATVAQKDLTGRWEGKLEDSSSLRLVLHFNHQSNGDYSCSMDSPDEGARGISCDNVIRHRDSISVYIPLINAYCTGLFTSDSIINGVWKQNGENVKITLKKGKEVPLNTDSNCIEIPITLETKTGKIYGTLCTPIKFTKIPVALIIAGSGPTDRDGNNAMGLSTDAYKILAHKLSNRGIATLRYDKRGIAASKDAAAKEEDIRFENFIDDAKAWVELLKADKRFSDVIIIGHSEGSLIGMDASTKDVNRFVSLAGAGQSADKILKLQLSNLPKMGKDTAFSMLDSLAAGKTISHVDPTMFSLFRPSVQPYLISWFKHDPQVDIKKLTIPVLILQGTSDLQVDTTDAKRLYAADPKAKLLLIKGMNHVLRDVDDDKDANKKSYTNPTMPIDEGLVNDIAGFITAK